MVATVEGCAPAPSHARPARRWVRACLLGAIILVCGIVIGTGLTLCVLWSRLQDYVQHPEHTPAKITRQLTRSLDLTDDQARMVEEILAKRQAALQAIRREARPRIEAELDGVREEVAAVLTPEQTERWRRRFDLLRERWLPPPEAGVPVEGASKSGGK